MVPAQAGGYLVRFCFAIEGHTAVTLFFGIEVIAVIAPRIKHLGMQLVLLGLGLLDTDHVGLLA